jgi:pyruvate/2-oxoglutarate dehydrogenase complex dihydrolipoamide acyltransferase (E2) component
MEQKRNGRYHIIPFPWLRVPIEDSLRTARCKPFMRALTEVDVTLARQALRAYQERTGEKLSFTAYIIRCVARAVEEHPMTQARRLGRGRLILFDDVDVCAQVEHRTGRGKQASPYVIRAANRKSLRAIHQEIRAAQAANVGDAWEMRGRRLYPYLPRLLRALLWRTLDGSPRVRKRIAGTVMVSAVGMYGKGAGWGISPTSGYTLEILLGGIVDRPAVVDGRLTVRQRLCMTTSADHNIIDGAPMARFVQRMNELIEGGDGLEEAGVSLAVGAEAARADMALAGR